MAFSLPQISPPNRNAVVLTLLAALVATAALYVYAYLPAQRQRVDAHYFRQLGRVERNINQKTQAYYKLVEGLRPQIDSLLEKENLRSPQKTVAYLEQQVLKNTDVKDHHFIESIKLQKRGLLDSMRVGPDPDTGKIHAEDHHALYISLPLRSFEKLNKLLGQDSGAIKLVVGTRLDTYLKGVYASQVFDHLVLLDGDLNQQHVFYSSFPLLHHLHTGMSENPGIAGSGEVAMSLLRDTTGLESSRTLPITINGQGYVLFVRAVRLGHQVLRLGAAVPQARYQAEVEALPPRLVELALSALLLIGLSFFLLKIILLSAAERLNRHDAWLSVLGAVLTLALLTQLLTDSYNQRLLVQPALQRQLRALGAQTRARLTLEVLQMVRQARAADSVFKNKEVDQLGNSVVYYKHKIIPVDGGKPLTPQEFGPIWRYRYPQKLDSPLSERLKIYPFASRMAWLDSEGWIRVRWDANHGDYAPNLKERDYFKRVVPPKEPLGSEQQLWQLHQLTRNVSDSTGILRSDTANLNTLARIGRAVRVAARADTTRFTFQAVTSWTDGKVTFAVSTPGQAVVKAPEEVKPDESKRRRAASKEVKAEKAPALPVVLISAIGLRTFDQLVLPSGYQVCLVDAAGEVLLHSDNSLSLKENLVDEDDGGALGGLLLSRDDDFLTVNYHQRPHLAWVQPVGTLPVSVVVLADLARLDVRQAQTLVLGSLMYTGLVLAVLTLGALGLLLLRRPTKLLARSRQLAWLWPRPLFGGAYWAATLGMGWGVLLLILWPIVCKRGLGGALGPIERLTMFTFVGLGLILFCYRLLRRHFRSQPPARPSAAGPDRPTWLLVVTAVLGLVLVWSYLDHNVRFIWLLLLLGLPLWILYDWFSRRGAATDGWLVNCGHQYVSSGAALATAWAVVAGLLPAYGCYQLAYFTESRAYLRQAQVELATRWAALTPRVERDRQHTAGAGPAYLRPQPAFFYATTIAFKPSAAAESHQVSKQCWGWKTGNEETARFTRGLNWLRTPFDSYSASGRFLLADFSRPANLDWPLLNVDDSTETLTYAPPLPSKTGAALQVTSVAASVHLSSRFLVPFTSPDGEGVGALWMLGIWTQLALVLTLCYLLGKFLIVRVCDARLFEHFVQPTPAPFIPFDANAPARLTAGLATGTSTWVVALAGSSLADLPGLDAHLKTRSTPTFEQRNVFSLANEASLSAGLKKLNDPPVTLPALLNFLPSWWPGALAPVTIAPLIVVENAELGLREPKLLESLFANWTKAGRPALVLLSTEEPNAGKSKNAVPDLRRLLGYCQLVYWPLYSCVPKQDPAPDPKQGMSPDELDLRKRAKHECSVSTQLNNLLPTVYCWIEAKCDPQTGGNISTSGMADDLILYLQMLATPHYQALWSQLSSHERFLLSDLAQDGLLNTRDPGPVEGLLRKGILRFPEGEHRLRLMNHSFNNFVLTAVSPAEALRWEEEAASGGAWAQVRGPLILVLAAVGLFLFITQETVFNRLGAYLTGLTVFVPLALRFVGLFTARKAQEAAE